MQVEVIKDGRSYAGEASNFNKFQLTVYLRKDVPIRFFEKYQINGQYYEVTNIEPTLSDWRVCFSKCLNELVDEVKILISNNKSFISKEEKDKFILGLFE